jgi:hypothetical protein
MAAAELESSVLPPLADLGFSVAFKLKLAASKS